MILTVAVALGQPTGPGAVAAAPAPYVAPRTDVVVPGRPAVVMPNSAQRDALDALTAASQARIQAVNTARTDLFLASYDETRLSAAAMAQKADVLAAAELDLANFRAAELAKLQASPNRLAPTQVAQLPLSLADGGGQAAAPAVGGRGGVGAGAPLPADPNTVIQMLPGFRTEVVARADRATQGSWISMTQDDQGRFILGANGGEAITRLTLDAAGKLVKDETIYTPISEILGMEWINGKLYAVGGRAEALVTGRSLSPNQSGPAAIFRMSDPAGDGSFSSIETMVPMSGDEGAHWDHGTHDVVLAPDGKHIYHISGNRTYQPHNLSPLSPIRHNLDDRVIPILGGPVGGGAGRGGPVGQAYAAGQFGYGGFITRMNLDGSDPHHVVTGLRNPIHFAFNGDGEMFIYDSDHEPERGVPWYTPTRVLWAPVGANFGHRLNAESGKYPEWYEDAFPPLYNIGLGSPVGVTFGYNAKFPAKYQKALYIADNNYGRIMALHLQPLGSGYAVSSMEYFAYPKSLFSGATATNHNVTDMMVGRDGNFYYVIGNRSIQAYLMRVVYTGDLPTAKVDYANADGAADRKIRHMLEDLEWQQGNAATVTTAWPHLGSEDRPIRYAARVALETAPPALWKQRALAEKDASTALGALLAFARVGGKESSEELFAALDRFPLAGLSDPMKIRKLRIIEVALSRNGMPSASTSQRIVADVDSIFPAKTFELNTESSQILAYFNAPSAVPKTMTVIGRTRIYQENFAYRYNIRSVTTGWTPELRKAYFQWFNEDHSNDAFQYFYREWSERVNQRPALAGNGGPIGQIRTAALATLSDQEKNDPELSALVAQPIPGAGGRGGGGRGGAVFGP